MTDQMHYTPFDGGVDLITPATQIKPGRLLACLNYECPVQGGYRAIDGYAQIGSAVPGEGSILGVAVYDDTYHAIRKETGVSTAGFWKWTGSAWSKVVGGLPLGRYTFDVAAFKAVSSSRELYMQADNAAAKPWKYNGVTCAEIAAAPAGGKFVKAHAFHLFIGFEDGSLQWSEIGDPTLWGALGGAGELGVSDNITGLSSTAGGVLIVFCRDSIHTLYGTSAAEFTLKRLTSNAGAKAYTVAEMAIPFFVGDRGMTSLQSVQEFGDFAVGDWGRFVEPLFTQQGFVPYAAVVSKKKNQYRVFNSTGRGVYATVAGAEVRGITLVQLAHNISATDSAEFDDGTEVMLFGDDAGAVFLLDSGNSFAGADINSWIVTAFNHAKSPTVRKRFRRAYFDIEPNEGVSFNVLPQFDGGSDDIARHRVAAIECAVSGGLWDVANWNEFAWSGPLFDRKGVPIAGTATSIGFLLQSTRNGTGAHTVTGYTLHYTPRRARRD